MTRCSSGSRPSCNQNSSKVRSPTPWPELEAPADLEHTLATLTAELRRVIDELDRYVAAIAEAGNVAVLAKAVAEREHRRPQLQRDLAALDSAARTAPRIAPISNNGCEGS